MVREDTSLSFEEYFWLNIDLNNKVILDAGTGLGITTSEIAKHMHLQKAKGKIISVDIDPESFKLARKRLRVQGSVNLANLLKFISFVQADLSSMPHVASESVDIVISTRTISDINSSPCHLTRALTEFYRVLKTDGQVILSDEYPLLTSRSQEEEVTVIRWQLVKAISHLIGKPHINEVDPEDLEFTMKLAGFRDCKWAIFKGEKISQQRVNYFVKSATEMTTQIDDSKLKNAFLEGIKNVRKRFNKQGGIFHPRYIMHAKK